MKRKRSQESGIAPTQKKIINVRGDGKDEPCHLLQVLTQYGLLIAIASNLFPKDLYALAATSKTAYKAIFSRQESRLNLLNKMSCDGRGVLIRSLRHKKSKYFSQFNCIQHVECGTRDTTRNTETRPCVSCSATTCDECRIHCVYQSIYQPPDEPDELPNLSGFALLSPPEMGILTPSHLDLTRSGLGLDTVVLANDVPITIPCHDQGFLDIPLESDTYASPESIAEILNTDLGLGPLKLSDSSTSPHPSPVIQAFWDITEQRKRRMCEACFIQTRSGCDCHCTLKSRFLDRWLCLNCYEIETKDIGKSFSCSSERTCYHYAGSFARVHTAPRTICLWCRGEVSDLTLAL